jgi:hypothetical protein
VLCGVGLRSIRRVDHSSRDVLPSVVCKTECDRESSIIVTITSGLSEHIRSIYPFLSGEAMMVVVMMMTIIVIILLITINK